MTAQECRLYRFYVRDPRAGYTTKTLGYVGETARMPFRRLMEHIESQPWADTIVGWEVDDRVFAGKGPVLAAESASIRAERPLYNIRENEANRERIPPWVALRQRAERDAARGAPVRGGVRVAQDLPRRVATAVRPVRRPSSRVVGTRFEGWLLGSLLSYPMLLVVGAMACARMAMPFWACVRASAVASAVVLVVAPVAWWLFKESRPRTRRKVGWLAAGALLLGALWLLWPVIGPHVTATLAGVPR